MLKKFIGVLLVVFFAMMSSSAQPKGLIDDYSVGGSYYFTLTDVESFNDYLYDGTEVNGYVVIATFPIAHLKTEFANEDIPNIAYFLVFKKEKEARKFIKDYKKIYNKFTTNYTDKGSKIKFFETVTKDLYNLTKKFKYNKKEDAMPGNDSYDGFEIWAIKNVRY